MEKIEKKDVLLDILLSVLAIAGVLLAIFMLRMSNQATELIELGEDVSGIVAKEYEEEDIDYMDIEIDFDTLSKINPDIYAWIMIPGTEVSYPILQSNDDEVEDYYLYRTFDKKLGYPGSIYTQKRNSVNFQ